MDFMALGDAPPQASGRLGRIVLGTISAAALVLGGATLLARPSSNSSADAAHTTRWERRPASAVALPEWTPAAGGPSRSWRASPARDNDPSGG